MRRARLKVQATVPIRRKLQEQAKAEAEKPPVPNDSATVTDKQISDSVTKEENPQISNSVVGAEKSPDSCSILNTTSPDTENTEKCLEKQTETEKPVPVTQTENNSSENSSIPNEQHNVKQEIVENIVENPSVEINREINNQESNNLANSSNAETNRESNFPCDGNNEHEKQIAAINREDNIEKSQSDQETGSNVEVTSSKHISNRSCFMRPVPRLDSGGRVRKNSVQGSGASASESEDDGRKSTVSTRVRNDSICSVQSNKDLSGGAQNISKIKVGQHKRRLTVSESAKKLADARREFMMKHENKAPDRSKLTMYDLIYYNPASNPMTRTENAAARKLSVSSIAVEEPQENEEEDEPTAMPVPRVKVGPDGQLIVDEKSLIIERTEQKNRSGPVVHDETIGGGFYKRRQKSKDWSKWDTLRFYKALSNIGTDFLLMQRFFPKRTRQELKLKFKKEERTNRKLVEQALKTQTFDLDVLKEEMEALAEAEKQEAEEALKIKAEMAKRQQRARKQQKCRFVVGSIEEVGISGDEDVDGDLSSGESRNEESQKKSRRTRRKRKSLNSLTVYDESNESSSDPEDLEIYNVKPTRSGRLPKRRKLQAPNVESSDYSDADESRAQDSKATNSQEPEKSEIQTHDIISNVIPNIKDIEPGSLVILTRESPGEPGKTVVQVYMVSKDYNSNDPNSEQNMTPVDLSPELLATVNSKISEVQPVHVKSNAANAVE